MQGKICLVTGANAGIGRVTAEELARRGATVVMLCRNQAKGEQARNEIITASGNRQVELILADFAALASVRRAAAEFLSRHQKLDVLVNNAGAFFAKRQLSQDGYELTFATNHLGPFLLTKLLLDALKAAAPARIINVSSEAHEGARLHLDEIPSGGKRYQNFRAYADSKLCNILFSYELARRLEGSGVTVNALHPGFVASNFGSSIGGPMGFVFRMLRPIAITPEKGAQTSIYLASAPELETITGKYFTRQQITESSKASYDQQIQTALWQLSEKLVSA
ncbi:MAG: SDR family oxidoreductase [Oscillochloris sp.]|nr:SDR family oxidoreductase [Oscillochloris sp.]